MSISIERAIEEGIEILSPLAQAFRTTEGLSYMLRLLGIDRDSTTVASEISSLQPIVTKIDELIEIRNAGITSPEQALQVVDTVIELQDTIRSTLPQLSALGLSVEKVQELFDLILLKYLNSTQPTVFRLLEFLGIAYFEEVDSVAPNPSPTYLAPRLNLDNIGKALTKPGEVAQGVYGWGTTAFNARLLVLRFSRLIETFGIRTQTDEFSDLLRQTLSATSLGPAPWFVEFLLLLEETESASLKIGIAALPAGGAAADDGGIALMPIIEGDAGESVPLTDTWSLQLTGSGVLAGGVITVIHPHSGLSVYSGLYDNNVAASVRGSVALKWLPPKETVLLGSENGARLAASNASIQLSFETSDISIELGTNGAVVALQAEEDDGFLVKILPQNGLRTNLDIAVGWSSLDGVYFKGSAALEVTIPVHKTLGPVTVESVYLAINVNEGITTTIAASAGAKIGPVVAAIDQVGIRIPITFPSNRDGNLGPVQIGMPEFKPPRGVGLALVSDTVKGGGFLELDNVNKQYSGILQLQFKDIGLVAIGLITTKMPDGSKGFSMLLCINVSFSPPICLPYNFKLMAVGGLVGIHRSMVVDVLRQGIKNKTLDSIMFPPDPILNASRIISDLRAVFPATQDRYVIGPMAKLGWSSPPLITADIGIFIELPNPVRIVILGQVAAQLPSKDKAIVRINMDMLGVVDFEKKTFSFDASLYDSRILTYTLTGDSALRMNWGDNPNFALAVGGLHPRFTPPPGFPSLKRLSLSLGSGNNPRINLETYQALTSNSAQFGARLEVYAKKGKFSVQGYLGFDALFIFSPFSFAVDIGAGVAVKAGSKKLMTVTLDLSLSGPTPWHAKGKATFKVLFVKVKVRFDETWGSREPVSLPAIDPTEQLVAALKDPGNWAGILPADAEMGVTLRKSEGEVQQVIVHPMGRLEVRQRVLPLEITLAKFGNAPVTGNSYFKIANLTIGAAALDTVPAEDHFARGQFENLPDARKLSAPSFEKFKAGVTAGTERVALSSPVPYALEYETSIIDHNRVTIPIPQATKNLSWDKGRYFMTGVAARGSVLRNAGAKKYTTAGKPGKVRVNEEGYAVAGMKDLKKTGGIAGNDGTMTHAQAMQAKDDYEKKPAKKGTVRVVRRNEVAA